MMHQILIAFIVSVFVFNHSGLVVDPNLGEQVHDFVTKDLGMFSDLLHVVHDILSDLRAAFAVWCEDWWEYLTYGWIVDLIERFGDSARTYACGKIPEKYWAHKRIAHWDCEMRIYPGWTRFKRSITTSLMLSVLTTVVSLVVCGCYFAATCERMITSSWFRGWRWAAAWCLNVELKTTAFRPLHPAGAEGGERWTTDVDGNVTYWDGGTTTTLSPLPVVNRLLSYWSFPAQVNCVRTGKFVEYTWRPVSWTSACDSWPSLEDGMYPVRVETRDNRGTFYYCCKAGTFTSVKLIARCWDTIVNGLDANGKDTQGYSIGAVVRRFHPNVTQDELTLIQNCIAAKWNVTRASTVDPEETQEYEPEQSLQFVGDRRDDALAPWKATGRGVLPKFVDNPDAMPAKGRQASLAAVHFRLDDHRNPLKRFDRRVATWAEEFVGFVARDRISPWTLEMVLESQNTPLQKIRNAIGKWFCYFGGESAEVKAMCKIEALANRNYIRNISTLPPEFNLSLGAYMLAAAEYLKKNYPWYCAGRTPRFIAERMAELAFDARVLSNNYRCLMAADVSKMDAAKSGFLTAWLTTRIYVKMFGVDDEHLINLRLSEATAPAKTSEGNKYVNGASQLSGSATTTIDNTLTSAFIAFAAHRIEGLAARPAFERLGAFCGDDSVSHNTPDSLLKAAKLLGYTIKPEEVLEGEDLPFLSRFFYSVWEGGLASIQDPLRILRKLHISIANRTISWQQAAANKTVGIAGIDPGVSFYQCLAHTVKRLTGRTGTAELSWMQQQLMKEGEWPWDERADAQWEKHTGISPAAFTDWLMSCRSFGQLMAGPPKLVEVERMVKARFELDPASADAIVPEEAERADVPEVATLRGDDDQPVPGEVEARARERTAAREIASMVRVETRQQATAPSLQATVTPEPVERQADPPFVVTRPALPRNVVFQTPNEIAREAVRETREVETRNMLVQSVNALTQRIAAPTNTVHEKSLLKQELAVLQRLLVQFPPPPVAARPLSPSHIDPGALAAPPGPSTN